MQCLLARGSWPETGRLRPWSIYILYSRSISFYILYSRSISSTSSIASTMTWSRSQGALLGNRSAVLSMGGLPAAARPPRRPRGLPEASRLPGPAQPGTATGHAAAALWAGWEAAHGGGGYRIDGELTCGLAGRLLPSGLSMAAASAPVSMENRYRG